MSLENKIKDLIIQKGPITVDHYIDLCLFDEDDGYYTSKNVIGRHGDFITSPEISQIFGELIALFIIAEWSKSGSEKPIHIIELGAGNGTLADDILRTFQQIPLMHSITYSYTFIEKSPVLKQVQQQKLSAYQNLSWFNTLNDFDHNNQFVFIVANEFFDALPIKQFIGPPQDQHERLITFEPTTNQLAFHNNDTQNIYEETIGYQSIIEQINRILQKNIGACLIIDYGDTQKSRKGDTLQGMKNHHYASILEEPGSVDISHQVDFYQLSKLLSTQLHQNPIQTQEAFLKHIGIEMRMNQLLHNATSQQKMDIISACTRLISPQHMGHIFKVLFAKNYD